MMDESNIHTSVLIELANQEEPEDQKTYQIDIDDLDIPKDYVIDQIFCGENVTVYALFEVPEASSKNSDNHILDVSSPNMHEEFKFFNKSSYKKLVKDNQSNIYKQNLSVVSSKEDTKFFHEQSKESFYCLKHLGGKYEMLSPEKKNSELKILYSNEIVSKSSKSTRFKAVSKGVNTDIVQSPKIIEEVQKSVGLNVPYGKTNKKIARKKSTLYSQPSYEVVEMEMRPSFSSTSSGSDCKRYSKKSTPNFFIVPFLMMEDGVLSHFQKEEKLSKLVDEKIIDTKSLINTKVSSGTNTDEFDTYESLPFTVESVEKSEQCLTDTSHFENSQTESENFVVSKTKSEQKKENLIVESKLSSKKTILLEIKEMQGKLNALIKTLESGNFEDNSKPHVCKITNSDIKPADVITDNTESASEPLLMEAQSFPNSENLEDNPICIPLNYSEDSSNSTDELNKKSIAEPGKDDTLLSPTKTISLGFVSEDSSLENLKNQNFKLAKTQSQCSVDWEKLNTRKRSGLSKSETSIPGCFLDSKYNPIHSPKKSFSLDLRDDKVEVLKKVKNFSLKLEGNQKTGPRILQNQETHSGDSIPLIKCDTGTDASKRSKTSKINLFCINQAVEKIEALNLKEIQQYEIKKEEGDAKILTETANIISRTYASAAREIQVNYCKTDVQAPEDVIKFQKLPNEEKPKTIEKNADVMVKSTDTEKPKTPIKNIRKTTNPDSNIRKEIKPAKKPMVKNKVNPAKPEVKEVLPETERKKILMNSRKSMRNAGDSKLHVDKFIKPEILNSIKALQSAKADEKQGIKTRPGSQRRDSREHGDFSVAAESKTSKKKSATSIQVESLRKKNFQSSNAKEKHEPVTFSEKPVNHQVSPEESKTSTKPSSVLLEFLSKKPEPVDQPSEKNQEPVNLKKVSNKENAIIENKITVKESEKNSFSLEKPVVKSVWALTKVLLYEDGTKKLEVLEASLTPPEYTLNQPIKSENEKLIN